MDTYAHGYGNTGHYAKPGTHTSYCGRELQHDPNTPIAQRICKSCAKAEKADRTAAEQVAADRATEGPTLAERAGVRYCEVGTGRRVHYSPSNDDTLCGYEAREYTDGPTGAQQLCARCIKAAEDRAYARSLAAASPLAAAAVELAEAADADQQPADVIRVATRGYRKARSGRVETITTVHTNCTCRIASTLIGTYTTTTEAERVAAEQAYGTGRTHGQCIWSRPLNPTPLAEAEQCAAFDTAARAVDAVQYAEEAAAQVDTVEEAEALYATALVTEADADAGTWRGEWIGEQQADTLFAVERPAEQGALFSEAAPAEQREKLVVRVRFEPADVERVKAKAAADRAAWRTEMDARKAAEAARYGTPEQAPARRVVEGVIVEHAGTSEGSTPRHAAHPNVTAARKALSGLAVARLTDRHDVCEPTAEEQAVRGYMVEPRGGRRVAVYWLEAGQTIRRDTAWHGPALDCLADRLTRQGWEVEPLLASSQCVFAHQPE
ncbi:hypothetical protein ACODT4_20685 [Streptomyces sp. 2.9]|uniref:hypothetical protein n=1 Tax=Streptomyces tritrimontium TaxID=3406573 RepID=UPI003BB7E15C